MKCAITVTGLGVNVIAMNDNLKGRIISLATLLIYIIYGVLK